MKVDQEELTAAIEAGRSAAHGDDTAAAELTGESGKSRRSGCREISSLGYPQRGCVDTAACARSIRNTGGWRFPWRYPKGSPAEPSANWKGPTAPVGQVLARREEWQPQCELARQLDKWLDPTCTFWTATDPVAPSASSGAMRKKRGVKPGVPDTLVLERGNLVTIELKSQRGQCSRSQRAVREALLRAGAQWWVCRSANAAMWALAKSGVRFRTLANDDGTIER